MQTATRCRSKSDREFRRLGLFDTVNRRCRTIRSTEARSSPVKILTRSFPRGSTFLDARRPSRASAPWLNEVCNQRIHGTTYDAPKSCLSRQRAALLPRCQTLFLLISWQRATVHPDSSLRLQEASGTGPFSDRTEALGARSEHSVEASSLTTFSVATHAQVSSLHTAGDRHAPRIVSAPRGPRPPAVEHFIHGCFPVSRHQGHLAPALSTLLPLSSHSQPPTGSTPPESSRP